MANYKNPMNILEALIQLRKDIQLWVSNNLRVKLDKNLGTENSGKMLTVDANGDIVPSNDVNLPGITEDESGELAIADEDGNIIMRVDAEGAHSANLFVKIDPSEFEFDTSAIVGDGSYNGSGSSGGSNSVASGGVSSYNNLLDKPLVHYTWDGVSAGRESITTNFGIGDMQETTMYKISDDVLTAEDLSNKEVTFTKDGNIIYKLQTGKVPYLETDDYIIFYAGNGQLSIACGAVIKKGSTLGSAGLYFTYTDVNNTMYPSKLTFKNSVHWNNLDGKPFVYYTWDGIKTGRKTVKIGDSEYYKVGTIDDVSDLDGCKVEIPYWTEQGFDITLDKHLFTSHSITRTIIIANIGGATAHIGVVIKENDPQGGEAGLYLSSGRGNEVEDDFIDPEKLYVAKIYKEFAGLSGSAATNISWDSVKDKPFYEETVTLTFDGDTIGKEVHTLMPGIEYVKVSDKTVDPNSVTLNEYIVRLGDSSENIHQSNIRVVEYMKDVYMVGFLTNELPLVIAVNADEATVNGIHVTRGIYFLHITVEDGIGYVEKVSYNTIKKLDFKYLDLPFSDNSVYIEMMSERECIFDPDDTGLYLWTNQEWDTEIDDYQYTTSFGLIEGRTYKITYDGIEYICKAFAGSLGTMTGLGLGNMGLVGGTDTGEPFLIGDFDDSSLLACYVATSEISHTMAIDILVERITPLPEKYLPKDVIISMIDEYIEEALGGEY